MNAYRDDQEAIRRTVRDFARRQIAPGAAERDATGQFAPIAALVGLVLPLRRPEGK